MNELLADAATRAQRYLDTLDARGVAPAPEAIVALERLHTDLPHTPTDPAEVLRLLDEIGSPATMANAGGRFFGFVNGGALPAAVAANWLATGWDQNAGMRVSSPIAATLEEVVLAWTSTLFGLPAGSGGALTTGATMANFSCLAAARHALLARAGWDVEARGLFGAPELRVIVGDEVHASLLKALALLGLGRERLERVPADDQGRLRAGELPPLDERTIVCIQAGNVNTGAFDPATEVCAAAREEGAWVHVDGAFGLWAAASPRHARLTAGFADADSWASDAHKWPNTPYDCGIALLRDPTQLRGAMSAPASYLSESSERNPLHHNPEMSRRARGVEVWAALLSLGRSGLAELIDRTCRHAERFAEGLREAGYEVLNDVVINQVLVSFGDPERTDRVIHALQQDGTCWCGGTEWQGKKAMRISVSSWKTTEEDVERSLGVMVREGRRE